MALNHDSSSTADTSTYKWSSFSSSFNVHGISFHDEHLWPEVKNVKRCFSSYKIYTYTEIRSSGVEDCRFLNVLKSISIFGYIWHNISERGRSCLSVTSQMLDDLIFFYLSFFCHQFTQTRWVAHSLIYSCVSYLKHILGVLNFSRPLSSLCVSDTSAVSFWL